MHATTRRTRSAQRSPVAFALAVAVLLANPSLSRADDVARSWTATNNLATARWCYGAKPTIDGAFTLHPNAFTDAQGVQYWRASASASAAAALVNPTGLPRTVSGVGSVPAASFALRSAPGQWSVVRWSAPVAGTYTIRARFLSRESGGTFAFLEAAIVRGNEVLFSRWRQTSRTGGVAAAVITLACATGDAIDFQLGPEGAGAGLDATVLWEVPDGSESGVIAFGPHRFAVARFPAGEMDELAFDPTTRRLAGGGAIRDRCGALVSAGPSSGLGLAWDPAAANFWQVTPDRVVRRWSAAGVLLDTVFTIPLTFVVPGTGLDTLESVRGIAVDSSFVYLVDAGPNPGAVTSNAWFKFTRAGAPVKSSRSTNFVANLDAEPDALVDDIVWSPMTSPIFPGRLLIALEHSGIQVVDRDGDFIAEFRWHTQNLPPKAPQINQYFGRLGAFAGLALDPVSGNLYLVDNDRAQAQVWVRLPGPGVTSYAVGVSSALEFPRPGCSLPLWELPPVGPVLLGLAWRSLDAMGYAVDINGGDLWRLDPRTGATWRVGPTGASAWGVAYAADRDLLYVGYSDGPNRVFAVDPRTADASPLPQALSHFPSDIAFNPLDGFLYGIDNGGTPRLIRISRDTGASSVVGNTISARGIDWDPGSNRLWAVGSGAAAGQAYSIDPQTGASTVLTSEPGPGSSDGLAVVRVDGSTPTVSVVGPHELPASGALEAWPSPARGEVQLRFALATASDADVRIFDVTGREVRRLQRGMLAAGQHGLKWNGRDATGAMTPAGVYFARVESDGVTRVARMVRVE